MTEILPEIVIETFFSLCDKKIIDSNYLRGYLKRSLNKGSISGLSYLELINRVNEYDQRKEVSNGKK